MSTDASFIESICDQARLGSRLTTRKMFGEYAVYVDGKVVAFACDNQLLLKPLPETAALTAGYPPQPPYPGAKPYWLIDAALDDPPLLQRLLSATADALPLPKPKPKPKPKPAKPVKPRKSPGSR